MGSKISTAKQASLRRPRRSRSSLSLMANSKIYLVRNPSSGTPLKKFGSPLGQMNMVILMVEMAMAAAMVMALMVATADQVDTADQVAATVTATAVMAAMVPTVDEVVMVMAAMVVMGAMVVMVAMVPTADGVVMAMAATVVAMVDTMGRMDRITMAGTRLCTDNLTADHTGSTTTTTTRGTGILMVITITTGAPMATLASHSRGAHSPTASLTTSGVPSITRASPTMGMTTGGRMMESTEENMTQTTSRILLRLATSILTIITKTAMDTTKPMGTSTTVITMVAVVAAAVTTRGTAILWAINTSTSALLVSIAVLLRNASSRTASQTTSGAPRITRASRRELMDSTTTCHLPLPPVAMAILSVS
ncbi:hypothetical protein B0T17DRAFT_516311 [Bombardia bombarda]|uniref:Uncharacterized protein n=1 Tax=Bombardia bombarda TaxID=252184 RepID=A0AA39XKT0_9PEZI|nr:hypothetical protein B0T17DRAFT_516311 [Bombardia bombarda]